MLTDSDIIDLVSAITYKPGWTFLLGWEGDRPFVQASVSVESDLTLDPTRRSSERTPWKSGKRHLSRHMCRQEVVGVVFGLIKDAEAHETHEWFRYRGAAIYNPHLDPDVLVDVARRRSSFCVRENAMTMEESGAEADRQRLGGAAAHARLLRESAKGPDGVRDHRLSPGAVWLV